MQRWQAYFLSGLLGVIVPLYPDSHHAGLVHNLLDDLTVLADHFAWEHTAESPTDGTLMTFESTSQWSV